MRTTTSTSTTPMMGIIWLAVGHRNGSPRSQHAMGFGRGEAVSGTRFAMRMRVCVAQPGSESKKVLRAQCSAQVSRRGVRLTTSIDRAILLANR